MKQTNWKNWTRKVIERSQKGKFSMKLYAQKYFDLGIPIVPIKIWWNKKKNQYDKQPLVEWKKWQTEGQNREEFDCLPWEQANGYAVVLGWKTKDGLFLSVVDYDVKGGRISEEGKAKGKEILDEFFPETRVERTANNGLHYLYFSSEPVKNLNKYHDACGLELFGKRLIVMAPSEGYKAINDKPILQVQDLAHIFAKSTKAVGLEKKKARGSKGRRGRRISKRAKIRPCIEALLKKNTLSHEERCAVAFEYLNIGCTIDEIVKLFQNQTDFDYAKTKQQLEHAKNTGYVPYSEEKLKEIGVCLGPTCPQYGKEQIFTSSVVLEDGRICEEGYDGTDVYYIVYDAKTQNVIKEEFIETEDKVYIPILNEDVENGLVKLPSNAIEYKSDAQLDEKIKDYLNRWHEQLDPVQRQLDVYYAKETYIKDLLPQIAYRRNLAKFGGGKSTFLEVLGSICYRSFSVAGCSTEAAIRRTFHQWQGTALIDEADFKDATLYATIVKILNIGFDSRTGWYKCCDENDPKQVLGFYVYGPKLIGTRERYRDTALESRCLTFFGRQNVGRLPLFRMSKFESEAQELRNKLLMWRFRNYYKLKEQLTVLEQIDAEEKIYGEVIDVRSRVKQIVLPLLLVVETKEERNNLSDFARAFDANLQNLDEECEWEDQISIALHKIFEENENEISIISKISIVYRQGGYKVYLLDFADALEIEDPKARNYWCRGLSKYFKKRTDFPIKKGTNNRAYVLLPKFYVDEILKKPLPLSYHANSANYANSNELQEDDLSVLENYKVGG